VRAWRVGIRFVAAAVLCGGNLSSLAQEDPVAPPVLDGREGRPLSIDRFRPVPALRVESHRPARARFPVVDVHVHPRIRLRSDPDLLDAYVQVMDQQNIAVSVSLDGQLGEAFLEHLAFLNARHSDRLVVFANIDWKGDGKEDEPASWDCHRPDFARRMARGLSEARERGAAGLKLFKDFGLSYKNPDGSHLAIDDPRWDPIWQACGELGLVVLIHTADPSPFFAPIDERNERWEELHRHPEWSFAGPEFPKRAELLAARNRVIGRHPRTVFIAAHVGNDGEDLAEVSRWFDEYPNLYVEIAARINELGRQPYTARKFFIDYADRILFGTDGPRTPERLTAHWRFLETWDEYFPYADTPVPPQGLWNIYGIGLPDDVLRKVYFENAARLIPGVRERLEKWNQ
jgi:predicted TIM-barrel fold metal-dependent hydrolase